MRNQRGFGAVEAIVIVLVIVILGAAGWVVYQKTQPKQPTATQSTASNTPNTQPEPTTITQSAEPDMLLYKNPAKGFSILIPNQFMSPNGAPCTAVYNASGELETYKNKDGLVPASVLEGDEDYYIAEKYSYQRTGKTVINNVVTFSGCEKVTSDYAKVNVNFRENDPKYMFVYKHFGIYNASNDEQILSAVHKAINSTDIVITAKEKSTKGDWYDLKLACTTEEQLCLNYRFTMRYYPEKHKVVYFAYGQSGSFYDETYNVLYDTRVGESLTLL